LSSCKRRLQVWMRDVESFVDFVIWAAGFIRLLLPYYAASSTGRNRDGKNDVSGPLSTNADWLAYLFLPKKDREALLGDLHEEAEEVLELFGRRRARIWYWTQVLSSIWPYVGARASKLGGWLKVGAIAEMIHRVIAGK
jgi:hypothetical protein